MKSLFALIPLMFIFLSSCETGSTGGKKYSETRGNANKTSIYGGCDNQTECWDYKGSAFKAGFESAQLGANCQAEGGKFVSNGCSDQNVVASCIINGSSDTETVLHFYTQSELTVQDAEQLCTAQNGVIKK